MAKWEPKVGERVQWGEHVVRVLVNAGGRKVTILNPYGYAQAVPVKELSKRAEI